MKNILGNKLVRIGILFFIALVAGGTVLYFTLGNKDVDDKESAEKLPTQKEKDKFFTVGNYSYSVEEIQKKVSSRFGLDYLLETVDKNLLADVIYSEEEFETIMGRYIFGEDFENLTEDEKWQYEQEFNTELKFLGLQTDEQVAEFIDLICKRAVFGRELFGQWILDNRDFFTEEQYQEAYNELYSETATLIILDFASIEQGSMVFEEMGIQIGSDKKFYDLINGRYVEQPRLAEAFITHYNGLNARRLNEYEIINSWCYSETREWIGGNYINYLKIDSDELQYLETEKIKFNYTKEELKDYYGSSVANLVFNKLTVADEENDYMNSFSFQRCDDGSYLFIYKIDQTLNPEYEFLAEEDNENKVPLEVFREVANYMYDDIYYGDLEELMLYFNRRNHGFKISDNFLNTSYTGEVKRLFETSLKCISYEEYIEIPKLNSQKNMFTYSYDNQIFEISNEEYYNGLLENYGNIIYRNILESYTILTSSKNNIYDPYNNMVYDQKAYKKLKESIDEDAVKHGYAQSVAEFKYLFDNNAFSKYGFDTSYGWKNFLTDYLGVIDENELIGQLLLEKVKERYLLDYYNYDFIIEEMNRLDQLYYNMEVITLYVTTTTSKYNPNNDFTSEQYVAAKELLKKLESIFVYYSGPDSVERIEGLVEEFNNAMFDDEVWGEYQSLGLRLRMDQPQHYTSQSPLIYEYQYHAGCAYYEIKDDSYYPFDTEEGFENYYVYGNPFEIEYGICDIIVTNAYSNPYSYEQTGYHYEDFTIEQYDEILANIMKEYVENPESAEIITYYYENAIDNAYDDVSKQRLIDYYIVDQMSSWGITFKNQEDYDSLAQYMWYVASF